MTRRHGVKPMTTLWWKKPDTRLELESNSTTATNVNLLFSYMLFSLALALYISFLDTQGTLHQRS